MRWIPGLQRPNFFFSNTKFSISSTLPHYLLNASVFLMILFIYSGGIYHWVEEPYTRIGDGNPVFIWPDLDRQFPIEGLLAGLIMFIGAGGLYSINQASNESHNRSSATLLQVLGTISIIWAFIILQLMYKIKTS